MTLRSKMLVLAALPVLMSVAAVVVGLRPVLDAHQRASEVQRSLAGVELVRAVGRAAAQQRNAAILALARNDAPEARWREQTNSALDALKSWRQEQDDLGQLDAPLRRYIDVSTSRLAQRAGVDAGTALERLIQAFAPATQGAAQWMDRVAIQTGDAQAAAEFRAAAVLHRMHDDAGLLTTLMAYADEHGQVEPETAIAMSVAFAGLEQRAELYNELMGNVSAARQLDGLVGQLRAQGWFDAVEDALDQQQVAALTERLLRSMGYGGFIHAFKNYVLRGDVSYLEQLNAKADAAQAVLDRIAYEAEAAGIDEQIITDLQTTLTAYVERIPFVTAALARGDTAATIDAQVKVSDTAALQAIESLTRWQSPMNRVRQAEAQQVLDRELDEAAQALHQTLRLQADAIYHAADRRALWTLALGGLVVVLVSLLAFSFYRRLSSGLAGFLDDLRHVTETGSVELQHRAGNAATDEIGVLEALVRQYNQRVASLAAALQRLADGDTSQLPEPLGPQDVMAQSLVSLGQASRAIEDHAQRIAAGDYDTSLLPRGERDTLSQAVNAMAAALADYRSTTAAAARRAEGQLAVLRAMRRPRSVGDLAEAVVQSLLHRLEADIGALYQQDEQGLVLQAHIGLPDGIDWPSRFDADHGQLGRALKAQGAFLLADLPADYLPVASGLGQTLASTVALVPLRGQGRVVGLLELAWHRRAPEQTLELLDSISESVALALDALEAKQRTEQLLEETRSMATRLEEQQEELRVSNEELEEQTQALRQSEEELKQQREELRTTNEELEEKSEVLSRERTKLEASARQLQQATQYKSEFLANMSHELRTPLNSMLILSRQLADNEEGNLTAEQSESARVVYESGRDLLNLINEILDLSKVEAGQLAVHAEPFVLKAVLNALRRQFEPMARAKGIAFHIECTEDLPEQICTDAQRLQQIVRNLVSNAIKFTAEGGVTLRVSRPEAGLPRPVGPAGAPWATEQLLAFSVIDTGIGIAPAKLDEIFKPFVQADGSTSRQYGGTGLGLSICREMATLLGGTMHASSESGRGSVFSAILPQWLEPAATDADTPPADPALAEVSAESSPADLPAAVVPDDRDALTGPGQAVLIIEDDPAFAAIVRDQIRARGRQALVALDGGNGLALAREYRPQGIVLDLRLPDMSGQQVLAVLKESLETRHIPVHIVSAQDGSVDALRMGAIGFLAKPVTREALGEVLNQIESAQTGQRRVLVLEDDAAAQSAIRSLLENDQTRIETESSGEQALRRLASETFDCIVLDLKLDDIDGLEFLKRLRASESRQHPPVIIYTGRDLTRDEHRELTAMAESVVIKGAESPERLLDEVTLFVHALNERLPAQQRQVLERLHDGPGVFEGKRLLVVDDDLRNTFALSGTLKKKGFEVHIADNGQMALEKLDQLGSVDLILMDIMMPVMDGYEAMARIRADSTQADLPIIALTAKAMPEDRRKCLEAGASDYLAKPIDMDRLLSMIRLWLGRAA